MQCILIFLDAMHFNILRQSGRSVYAYFKIYFYMPNFASIGRVDLVLMFLSRPRPAFFDKATENGIGMDSTFIK